MNGQVKMLEESGFALNASLLTGIAPEKTRLIPLTQEKFAIVDAEDYEWLNRWKWFAHKNRHTFYAIRRSHVDGKWGHVKMHREILGLIHGDGQLCDHKNRNGLDNRKENLRIATYSLNNYNRKMSVNNTSGYRGVSWQTHNRRWIVHVPVNGTQTYFGSFTDVIEAAKAYDAVALKYWGNDAALNFPKEVL
jgi:hypothetical protein